MRNALWAIAVAGAGFFGWHLIASGLRQRPRAWSEVCLGVGLPIMIVSIAAGNAVRHTGHSMPAWLVAFSYIGVFLLLGGILIGDQETLSARPAAWGDPPTVAGLRRAHWAAITCAVAGGTAAWLAIPGDDLAQWAVLSGMCAPMAGFGWLRCYLRQSAPAWLMRLGGRSPAMSGDAAPSVGIR